MKKSQNPSAVRSRQEISTALLKLMQEYLYAEISVKQIIMETSLARKTFYLNFSSKDDVLEMKKKILPALKILMKLSLLIRPPKLILLPIHSP